MHQPADRSLDRIRLTGIAATGYHGVFAHERRDGQTFVADVVLHVDTRPAAHEDRLDRTVDYGAVAEQVAGVLTGEPADLLETVAERIAAVALAHPAVEAVDVVLHKPQAPITVPFTDVTVEVHRDREHRPVVGVPSSSGPATRPAPADVLDAAVPLAEIIAPHLATGVAGGVATPLPLGGSAGAAVVGAGLAATGAPTPAPVPFSPDVAAPAEVAAGEAPMALPALTLEDRLDVAPDEPVDVVLALGSNVGASQETLRRAIWDLAAVDGLELTVISPLARTAAVGGPEQPDYLNAVVLGRTTLAPRALLHATQAVEAQHGRVREEHWGPRTLDVDIVLHGRTVAVADDLELPHPRAHQRAFVLQPWAQVDPDAVLPGLGGGPVADLARTAPDREGIRWMALDWWKQPEAGS
ncbi:2-amino-4-hydroxy-6-hydroxymethyldihydropteridine diphosphokinase [Cellulomonas sp. APG4]|uniref:2-amino-4-hydroxy-6- hydroxymethyldihydropteridine diphosphokinase n=1 Tax=Cellulomonas sp. APG4 TaxID=1538656 RepID=UPI00137A9979|nr:2-amino-4-hydroxy-6-hydroxymethyldihydropteridine diphosphokinase [Cellulomonas sp. APG4]